MDRRLCNRRLGHSISHCVRFTLPYIDAAVTADANGAIILYAEQTDGMKINKYLWHSISLFDVQSWPEENNSLTYALVLPPTPYGQERIVYMATQALQQAKNGDTRITVRSW